jgi:ADP-ribosylation factor GTPase-activating protein 2/3
LFQWETKSSTSSRFEGKNSISSADYFGTGSNSGSQQSMSSRSNYNIQAPDLDDIKEGVKQGITKVAGRLSNMASYVTKEIQDRYG